jgi:transcriptional regulator with XRE-family HTH domain
MSGEDLASCTRYALGQIRLWLRGSKPISAAALQELALALSVDAPAELRESAPGLRNLAAYALDCGIAMDVAAVILWLVDRERPGIPWTAVITAVVGSILFCLSIVLARVPAPRRQPLSPRAVTPATTAELPLKP